LCFLLATRVHNQMANRLVKAVLQRSRQCRYTSQRATPFPLKITLSHGRPGPPSNTIPWAHLNPQPKRHLDWSRRFCTDDCTVFLCFTMGCLFPLKIAPFREGSGPRSKTWFSGPIQVLNPNGISIGSAVSARLTSLTDRQTMLLCR